MYLLDTNVCIRLLNGASQRLAERLRGTPPAEVRLSSIVKAELLRSFSELLDPLLESARTGGLTAREAERRAWTVLVKVGALLVTALFAILCRRATTLAVARDFAARLA